MRPRRYWARMALWTAAAAAAAVLFGGVSWRTPWRFVLQAFAVSLVFTMSIVPIIAITMPRLYPAVHSRVRSPFHWPIVIAVLVVYAIGQFMIQRITDIKY